MDKSTLVRVRGGVAAMLVFQSATPRWRQHTKLYKTHNLNYHYFSKIRSIKPKIDKLTNSTQLYTPLE